MMARVTRPVLLGLLVLAGLTFGFDATSFGLQPPRHGRAAGCYTLLDDLFRTTRPSDPLRSAELGLSVVFVGAAAAMWYTKRRQRDREYSPRSA